MPLCGRRYSCCIWLWLAAIFVFHAKDLSKAVDLPSLPAPVSEKISQFKPNSTKAVIVRTDEGPWILATATGNASMRAPPSMERDSATRAAVVGAKRRMAELLSAEIETYVSAYGDSGGKRGVTRKVTVAVSSQLLSRVQLLREHYDPDAKRCHVLIASAPANKAVSQDVEFADAKTAAQHLLYRCSRGLCPAGVVCARLQGSTVESPRLALISVAVGPRAPNGSREVANVKAQAALTHFWSEKMESLVTLEQGVIPDPDDPMGSRVLNFEHFKTWAMNRQDAVLPPFASIGLDRDNLCYVAIWCGDGD